MINKYQKLLQEVQKERQIYSNSQLNDRILLIDGMNNFIRSFAANNQMDLNGNLVGGCLGFLKTIGYAIKHLKPTRCFVIFDGKGGNKRRREIYPFYKKKRDVSGKYNRFYKGSKEEEDYNMKWQFMVLLHLLDYLPVQVISIDYLEGDDIISYISNNYKSISENIYINSTDKDFLQLVDDVVKVWNPVKKKLYSPTEVQDEYKVLSSNFIIYKSIMGDSSDNIDGVKGIGKKTVENKFSFLNESYISFNDFFKYCEENSNKNKKFEKVLENKETVLRNKKLMDLTNNDIMSSGLKSRIGNIMRSDDVPPLNKRGFINILINYNLYDSFITNPDYWLSNVFNMLSSFSDIIE